MSLVAPMKIVKVVSDKDFGYECKCVDNTCVDINEGTTDNSCPENFSCLNTLGSFNCNCLDGFKMNSNGACNDINEYTLGTNDCNSNGDDVSCNDIDECNDGSDTCGDNSICSNTVGSFTGGCVNGYPLQQENWGNIDECNLNPCNSSADFVDTNSSYTCVCTLGFNGDGFSCNDVDECLDVNRGADDDICNNSIGSYNCKCKMISLMMDSFVQI